MKKDKTVIIHLKTKDIEQAKINYNRMSSTFDNHINPTPNNTKLSVEESKELITDEIAFECGNFICTATPYEIFAILHNRFVDRLRAAE